jgi:hypothetical protein
MEPQGAVGGIGWGMKERDLLRSAWSREDRGWQILRTLNRDGAREALGRLEAKHGPDFRGGWERELIPDENEELFKESPSHSSSLLQGNVPLRKARPLPSVVGLCLQAVNSDMFAWPL